MNLTFIWEEEAIYYFLTELGVGLKSGNGAERQALISQGSVFPGGQSVTTGGARTNSKPGGVSKARNSPQRR